MPSAAGEEAAAEAPRSSHSSATRKAPRVTERHTAVQHSSEGTVGPGAGPRLLLRPPRCAPSEMLRGSEKRRTPSEAPGRSSEPGAFRWLAG